MNQARLDEFNRIVNSSRDVKEFYENFLTTFASISNARVAVAWNCTAPPFHPICQIQAKAAQPTRLPISEQNHMELINRAAQNERAFIVKPKVDEQTNDSFEQPILLFGPIHRDSQTELVEFVIPHNGNQEDSQRVLQELDEFCSIAAMFEEKMGYGEPIHAEGQRPAPGTHGFGPLSPETIDQYAHAVHADIDFKKTSQTVVNEARRVLDCDRVSVAIKHGKKFRLLSVSGQPSVNRRSNTTHLLGKLTTRALATDQAFWYPSEDQLPPQIDQPLQEYLGISATRSLAILPVYDEQIVENNDPTVKPRRPKVIAGLIIEQCNEQWNRTSVAPSIETVGRHASDAIRNSLRHRDLFGYSLWRLLGKSKVVTAARNVPKTLAVLAGLLVLGLVLSLVPAPFTLHSDGLLLPQLRRKVFAEVEGQVAQINVDHGSLVQKEQVLLEMQNENLDEQLVQVSGELDRLTVQLETSRKLRIRQSDSESGELANENRKALESQIVSLQKQMQTLKSKSEKLSVKSPVDGEVITWDLNDRLTDRPVKTGDLLLEVADVEGDWELELNLPDRRIGHLLRELERREASGNEEGIKVTYKLAADPGSRFTGRIKRVSQATQLTSDQKQGVRIVVEIDTKDVDTIRQARSGVSAKIHCGYEPLGYVWLHDVFEFVQSNILFRIW